MKTKQQRIRTKCSEIFIDDDGILWLVPDIDADLDLEEVIACYDAYKEMGLHEGNKVLQIIDIKGNASMNREARDYAAKFGNEFFIASAVISTSMSVRLIVNFFNLFYTFQKVPLKLFDSEENARKWLFKFIK